MGLVNGVRICMCVHIMCTYVCTHVSIYTYKPYTVKGVCVYITYLNLYTHNAACMYVYVCMSM